MKITTASVVGFLLALSSLNLPNAEATKVNTSQNQTNIESRLNRIAKVIKEKESQVEESSDNSTDYTVGQFLNIAPFFGNGGWGNGFRNGGWRNGWRNGGWRNWGNGWRNGGWRNWGNGFRNGGWRNGGGFFNR